tara:strand:+ start:749 stop:1639 length:891 start_codon:yes stop_codon:yes gene_type:complete
MCKIAGGIFHPNETNQAKKIIVAGRTIIKCAEQVNKDATGIAIVNPTGIHVYKNSKTASDFVKDEAFFDFVTHHANEDTIAFIGHCRFATQGSNQDNSNNHPIIDRPIYGVHNGVITNDTEIAKEYGTCADVDSAVMFSMLKRLSNNKPLTAKSFTTAMNKLRGSATIVAVDERDPTKIFIGLKNNPMNLVKVDDVLWFASTHDILADFINVMGYADADLYINSIKNIKNYSARVFTQKSVSHDWFKKSSKYKLDAPVFTATKYQSFGKSVTDYDYENFYKQLKFDKDDTAFLDRG